MHFLLQTLGIAGNAARWLDFPPSVINDPERRVPARMFRSGARLGLHQGLLLGWNWGAALELLFPGGWQILCGNSEICKVIFMFVFVI